MAKTTTSLGMELPVIADLGNGFYLAEHENGPVICNEHSLASLCFCGYEPQVKFVADDDDAEASYTLADAQRARHGTRLEDIQLDDEGFPFEIRASAIREYVNWTIAKSCAQWEFFIVACVPNKSDPEKLPTLFKACCDDNENQIFADQQSAARLAAALTEKYKVQFSPYRCSGAVICVASEESA